MSPTTDALQSLWRTLNIRYFHGALAPIRIEWSPRLTSSAGLFISRHGPRPRRIFSGPPSEGRLIRLSIPLLQGPDVQPDGVLLTTLAHEMIHQWQFDVLRRRPNHGPDFCRKMRELNRDGLGITIRHRMNSAVRALTKYTWHCQRCGRTYKRQRRTIHPNRHRCGVCRGQLCELDHPIHDTPRPALGARLKAGLRERLTLLNRGVTPAVPSQLSLPLGAPL